MTAGGCEMFALVSRVFGSVMIGICLSTFGMVLVTLLLTVKNLPRILSGLQRLLRALLRGSFRLYSAILNPVRVWVFQQSGFDILTPVPRTLATVTLSLVMGVGLLAVFSMPVKGWMAVVLFLHGLFVGLAWEGILRADDFQLGVNLE